MCGRFSLKTPPADLAAHFGLAEVPNLEARYNVAPSQDIAVVRESSTIGTPRVHALGNDSFRSERPDGGSPDGVDP